MPIEHIGLGVPDVDAAKVYFDRLMPMVGFQPCFGNGYCPDDFQGTQLYLYAAREAVDYSTPCRTAACGVPRSHASRGASCPRMGSGSRR